MKSSAKNIKLTSVDELFSPTAPTINADTDHVQDDHVQEMILSNLHSFKDHPFRVVDDEAMANMVESIKDYGVLVPVIARPDPNGGYELVAGHRRCKASELAGKETIPVIIRDLDDDAATIIMVDSNLQRESILPSERAFAYKMKLDAVKHQGARTDLTSVQVEQKLSARDQIAKEAGERSGVQVMRYIRLTELERPLLDMVDKKKIPLNPAYELSFLSKDEQVTLMEVMKREKVRPSLSQAQRLKKFSQEGKLSEDVISAILSEEKTDKGGKVTFKRNILEKYFPENYSVQDMEDTIITLLAKWAESPDE